MCFFSITPVSWADQASSLAALRRCVFIEEQGVPDADEWDGLDEQAQHFLVTANRGPIGTARVVIEPGMPRPAYHLGRVAVLPEYRRKGVGKALVKEVINWCHCHSGTGRDRSSRGRSGQPQITLNAQLERVTFYQSLGFTCQGEVFMDAGIAHRAMVLNDCNC